MNGQHPLVGDETLAKALPIIFNPLFSTQKWIVLTRFTLLMRRALAYQNHSGDVKQPTAVPSKARLAYAVEQANHSSLETFSPVSKCQLHQGQGTIVSAAALVTALGMVSPQRSSVDARSGR